MRVNAIRFSIEVGERTDDEFKTCDTSRHTFDIDENATGWNNLVFPFVWRIADALEALLASATSKGWDL